MSRRIGLAALVVGLAIFAAGSSAGGVSHRDAATDVKGGPGPDITAVTAYERAGQLRFRIEFEKAPPLAFGTKPGFTDMLIVTISTTGKIDPRRANYYLGVHGAALKRVMLVRLPQRHAVLLGPALVSGRSLTLSLSPRRIGDAESIRFSVAAGREMNEGAGGGEDHAPNRGTWLWAR